MGGPEIGERERTRARGKWERPWHLHWSPRRKQKTASPRTGKPSTATLLPQRCPQESGSADGLTNRVERGARLLAEHGDGREANHNNERQHDGILDRGRAVFAFQELEG